MYNASIALWHVALHYDCNYFVLGYRLVRYEKQEI